MFMCKKKDGGPESPVDAYFLIEIKKVFNKALLKFNKGGREAFHTHAFSAFTWFLKGRLVEEDVSGELYTHKCKLLPKLTKKDKNHRVKAIETSWCLTVRGPWDECWTEYSKNLDETTVFQWGRKVVRKFPGLMQCRWW